MLVELSFAHDIREQRHVVVIVRTAHMMTHYVLFIEVY